MASGRLVSKETQEAAAAGTKHTPTPESAKIKLEGGPKKPSKPE